MKKFPQDIKFHISSEYFHHLTVAELKTTEVYQYYRKGMKKQEYLDYIINVIKVEDIILDGSDLPEKRIKQLIKRVDNYSMREIKNGIPHIDCYTNNDQLYDPKGYSFDNHNEMEVAIFYDELDQLLFDKSGIEYIEDNRCYVSIFHSEEEITFDRDWSCGYEGIGWELHVYLSDYDEYIKEIVTELMDVNKVKSGYRKLKELCQEHVDSYISAIIDL